MSRKIVSVTLILIDAVIVVFTAYLAVFIRFEGIVDSIYYGMLFNYFPLMIIIRLATFHVFGLYHRLWRYASIHELLAISGAVTVSSFIILGVMVVTESTLPRSVYFLTWFFNIAFIGASRLCIRILYHLRHRKNKDCTRVLIIGAGDAGAILAREIQQRYYEAKKIVGFIDDDHYKQQQRMFGIKVLGGSQDIQRIVRAQDITEIIIAIPSLGGSQLRQIVHSCRATQCQVKTLPGIYQLMDGKVTVQQLRSVDLEDLLRRDPVTLDLDQIAGYLTGKIVLVTGAGGSIGSELCRQIAKMSPASLVLLGKGENSIYEIDSELRGKYPELRIKPMIADVRDGNRINSIFQRYKPQVVFHAAAHKHVPLMEAQPEEAVQNNIFGTKTVAEAADRAGTGIFVIVSTDKAVNPTSVMGATKRVAEQIIQSMSTISATKFVAVRFGNVLGSRGSVVPLFKKQIAAGGPITITHPDMRRYFMTIPEATQLVLQAGAIAKGGEVFVLDMGEPVKIADMACDLIELSGLVPHKDIAIKITGLRPGEKLFEELLTAEEGTTSTKHEKIFVANLKVVDEAKLQRGLLALQAVRHSDEIIKVITNLVPTYQNSRQKHCGIDTNEAQIGVKKQSIDSIGQYQTVSDLH